MKYIKTYETVVYSDDEIQMLTTAEKRYIKNCKFKIGDYVKINYSSDNYYKIKGIDVPISKKVVPMYSIFDLNDNFVGWMSDIRLEPLSEIEINTIKYNL